MDFQVNLNYYCLVDTPLESSASQTTNRSDKLKTGTESCMHLHYAIVLLFYIYSYSVSVNKMKNRYFMSDCTAVSNTMQRKSVFTCLHTEYVLRIKGRLVSFP